MYPQGKYSSLSAAEKMAADNAAEWFIDLLIDAAELQGKPLTGEQIWILKHPISDFTDEIRDEVIATNNRVVELTRKIIRRLVADGKPSIKVRTGLWVPNDIEAQYELLFTTEQPWFISAVLQNVFFGNPMVGEKGNWTPNNKPPVVQQSSKDGEQPIPNLTVASKDLLKPKQSGIGRKLWFIFGYGFLILIVFVGCTNLINSSSETVSYDDSSQNVEQVDAGAQIPGDYYDDGDFAWQWVSDPTCEDGTTCTQIRVFSKFGCEYEVWIYWQSIDTDNPSNVEEDRAAIAPMARGETSIATQSRVAPNLDYGFDYENQIDRIACGQTG